MAGAIERLIKSTRIHQVNLGMFNGLSSPDYSIHCRSTGDVPTLPVTIQRQDCELKTELVEIVGDLKDSPVTALTLSQFQAIVHDEPLDSFRDPKCQQIQLLHRPPIKDIFKEYKVSRKLHYSASIRDIPISMKQPAILRARPLRFPQVRENLYLIKRIRIKKKPACVYYLSEKKQLVYWRKAVLQSRKDPKKLEMIGIYYDIPSKQIDGFKIDYKTRQLSYRLKENISAKKLSVSDIIIFRDTEQNKGIIIED